MLTSLPRTVRLLLVLTVWLLPAGGEVWGQTYEALRSQRAELDAAFARSLEELAAKCDELGMAEQAGLTRGWIIRRDPKRQYLFLPPGRTPADRPPADASRLVNYWHEAFLRCRATQADGLFSLARRAVESGDFENAYRLLFEVLRENPDHEQARTILGYRRSGDVWLGSEGELGIRAGRNRHPTLGWLPKQYWQVETDHFQIVANTDRDTALQLGEKLERLYAVWSQVFVGYWSNESEMRSQFKRPQRASSGRTKYRIVLFARREEYLAHLKPREPRIEISLGLYRDAERTTFFYVRDDGVDSTFLHEVTHQLFQETVPVRGMVGMRQNFWVLEGVAMYMESLAEADGYCTVGGLDAVRLQYSRYRLLNEKFYVPIEQLVLQGREKYQTQDDLAKVYSQSAGLTHCLMDAEEGRYRRALVEYVRRIYQQRDGPNTLYELTDASPAELDAFYRRGLQVTDEDLARLPWPERITDLCLGHTQVTDRGLEALKEARALRWLDLAATQTTDQGVELLAAATGLRQLNLEETAVTDRALQTIARFTQLEELDLSKTGVTDQGLAHLAGLRNLAFLWLTGTGVSDRGLEQLYGLKRLEMVHLGGTRVTQKGAGELKRHLPLLKSPSGNSP